MARINPTASGEDSVAGTRREGCAAAGVEQRFPVVAGLWKDMRAVFYMAGRFSVKDLCLCQGSGMVAGSSDLAGLAV